MPPVQLVSDPIVHLPWTAGFPRRWCARQRANAFATVSALVLARDRVGRSRIRFRAPPRDQTALIRLLALQAAKAVATMLRSAESPIDDPKSV